MSAPTEASTTIRGELTAAPGDTPRHQWYLEVADSLQAVGPAGIAVLALPTGVRVAFDYQQPDRLVALVLPCLDEEDLPPGSVDDEDLELVVSLVGTDAAACLHEAAERSTGAPVCFDAPLATTEAQEIAGRMALLTTFLDDLDRPLDGLWAAEMVGLAARWGQLSLLPLANHLAHVAAPALRLLRPDWPAGVAGDDERAADLLDTLLACQQAAPSATLGPLLASLRQRLTAADAVTSQRPRPTSQAQPPSTSGPDGHVGQVPTPTDAHLVPPEITTAGPVTVLVDHTLHGWVDAVDARLDDEVVHIRVHPAEPLAGLSAAQRITTRIVGAGTDDGVLLTAGLSMRRQPDGWVTGDFDVPRSSRSDELTVALGRHLPLTDHRGAAGFARRQEQHHARRALDARVASRFLADALPVRELIDLAACIGSDDPEVLAAARSLLWPVDPDQAARVEAARIATGSDRGALSLAGLDALLFDALPAGVSREVITAIDHEAARRHDPGTPVLPIYLVVDESAAMLTEERQLRAGIGDLLHALREAPATPPEIHVGVVGFAERAHLLQPLMDCRRIESAPTFALGGTRSYRAAFEQLRNAITDDVAALQASKHEVLRPAVVFLTGGTPNQQEDWSGAYEALIEDFEHAPDVMAFGLGDTDAATLANIATREDWAYRLDKGDLRDDDPPRLFDALTRAIRGFGLDPLRSEATSRPGTWTDRAT